MAVCSWGGCPLHTPGRFLAEYGRVNPAHFGTQSISWTKPRDVRKQIIHWLEAVARAWNSDPTPFEWGVPEQPGERAVENRQTCFGGSGAVLLADLFGPSYLIPTMAIYMPNDH